MKKETLELNRMGLVELSEGEMREIGGGGFWSWVAGTVAAIVDAPAVVTLMAVAGVVDAAYSLGKGAVNGWNSVK